MAEASSALEVEVLSARWRKINFLTAAPSARQGHTCTAISGTELIVVAGMGASENGARSQLLNDVWHFDAVSRRWSELPCENMPEAMPPRYRHTAALVHARRGAASGATLAQAIGGDDADDVCICFFGGIDGARHRLIDLHFLHLRRPPPTDATPVQFGSTRSAPPPLLARWRRAQFANSPPVSLLQQGQKGRNTLSCCLVGTASAAQCGSREVAPRLVVLDGGTGRLQHSVVDLGTLEWSSPPLTVAINGMDERVTSGERSRPGSGRAKLAAGNGSLPPSPSHSSHIRSNTSVVDRRRYSASFAPAAAKMHSCAASATGDVLVMGHDSRIRSNVVHVLRGIGTCELPVSERQAMEQAAAHRHASFDSITSNLQSELDGAARTRATDGTGDTGTSNLSRPSTRDRRKSADDSRGGDARDEDGPLGWTSAATSNPPPPRSDHSMCLLADDTSDVLLVFGGYSVRWLGDLHALHVRSGQWQPVRCTGSAPPPREGHSCCALSMAAGVGVDPIVGALEATGTAEAFALGESAHICVGMDTQLVVFGGKATECFNDMYVLDVAPLLRDFEGVLAAEAETSVVSKDLEVVGSHSASTGAAREGSDNMGARVKRIGHSGDVEAVEGVGTGLSGTAISSAPKKPAAKLDPAARARARARWRAASKLQRERAKTAKLQPVSQHKNDDSTIDVSALATGNVGDMELQPLAMSSTPVPSRRRRRPSDTQRADQSQPPMGSSASMGALELDISAALNMGDSASVGATASSSGDSGLATVPTPLLRSHTDGASSSVSASVAALPVTSSSATGRRARGNRRRQVQDYACTDDRGHSAWEGAPTAGTSTPQKMSGRPAGLPPRASRRRRRSRRNVLGTEASSSRDSADADDERDCERAATEERGSSRTAGTADELGPAPAIKTASPTRRKRTLGLSASGASCSSFPYQIVPTLPPVPADVLAAGDDVAAAQAEQQRQAEEAMHERSERLHDAEAQLRKAVDEAHRLRTTHEVLLERVKTSKLGNEALRTEQRTLEETLKNLQEQRRKKEIELASTVSKIETLDSDTTKAEAEFADARRKLRNNLEAGAKLSREAEDVTMQLKQEEEQRRRDRDKLEHSRAQVLELERLSVKLREDHKKFKIDVATLRQSVNVERHALENASNQMREARDLKKNMRQRLAEVKSSLLQHLRAGSAGTDKVDLEHLPHELRLDLERESGDEMDSSSIDEYENDFMPEDEADANVFGDVSAPVASTSRGVARTTRVMSSSVDDGVDLSYSNFDPSVFTRAGDTVTGITPREELDPDPISM